MAGATENREGAVLPSTTKVTVWPDSHPGPGEIPVAQPGIVCAPEPSGTVMSGPLVKAGGSLIGVRVTVNVRVVSLGNDPPSFTFTVITTEPHALAAGINVNDPVAFGLV